VHTHTHTHTTHARSFDILAVVRDVVDPVEVPSHPATAALAAVRARDHFTKAEVDALLHLPSLGTRDRLILCILAETGLRRRAVAWLTVDGVYDAVAGTARPVATATEKGLVSRQFLLSTSTRALLEGYVRRGHPHEVASPWLFPSPRQPTVPIRAATVNRILQRACRDLGIRGRHIHSHAMRKFVVVRLMQLSNRIEDVSKWLGHRSVHTTFGTYYPGLIHHWMGPVRGMSSRMTWWAPCTSLGSTIMLNVLR
jgi:integrase